MGPLRICDILKNNVISNVISSSSLANPVPTMKAAMPSAYMNILSKFIHTNVHLYLCIVYKLQEASVIELCDPQIVIQDMFFKYISLGMYEI